MPPARPGSLGDLRQGGRDRLVRRRRRRTGPVRADRVEGGAAAGGAAGRAADPPHLAPFRADRGRTGAGGAGGAHPGRGRGGRGRGECQFGGAARPRSAGGADVVRSAPCRAGAAGVPGGLSRGVDRSATRRPDGRPDRRRHRRRDPDRGAGGFQPDRPPALPGAALGGRRARRISRGMAGPAGRAICATMRAWATLYLATGETWRFTDAGGARSR